MIVVIFVFLYFFSDMTRCSRKRFYIWNTGLLKPLLCSIPVGTYACSDPIHHPPIPTGSITIPIHVNSSWNHSIWTSIHISTSFAKQNIDWNVRLSNTNWKIKFQSQHRWLTLYFHCTFRWPITLVRSQAKENKSNNEISKLSLSAWSTLCAHTSHQPPTGVHPLLTHIPMCMRWYGHRYPMWGSGVLLDFIFSFVN